MILIICAGTKAEVEAATAAAATARGAGTCRMMVACISHIYCMHVAWLLSSAGVSASEAHATAGKAAGAAVVVCGGSASEAIGL